MIDLDKAELEARAGALGFLDVRVASARAPAEAAAVYADWIAAGYHGEMDYLERLSEEKQAGVEHVLPGAKSVIVLAASYYHSDARGETDAAGNSLRTARYALGVDYHYVLKDRLAGLVAWLDSAYPGHQWRVATDSAPIMERAYAAAAGLGFIGKNGMLITWMQGSFTLLAEILTTAEIEPDPAIAGDCGNCTRCLDACPTQAFVGPGILDSQKCISYLTIEKKTGLTDTEAHATGEWIFGCDICQDVCPYNKHPQESRIEEFEPGRVLNMYESPDTFLDPASNRQFERRFQSSPLLRAGKRRLQELVRRKSGASDD